MPPILSIRHINPSVASSRVTITVHEGESIGQLFVVNHLWVIKAHLFQQLLGCFHGFIATRDRQGETQLCLAVVHRVAVRLHTRTVQGLIKIFLIH